MGGERGKVHQVVSGRPGCTMRVAGNHSIGNKEHVARREHARTLLLRRADSASAARLLRSAAAASVSNWAL